MSSSIQRVALVTGCGKQVGIGSATARSLAKAGIAVALSDVQDGGASNSSHDAVASGGWTGLQTLVDEIRSEGGTAFAVRGDVSSESDVKQIVKSVLDQYGRLDILVNNAAAPHGADRADIEDVPVDAWDRVMAINVRGAFLTCREVVPIMRAQAWGRIINMSSLTGTQPFPFRAAYSASKAALIGLTKSLSIDLAPSGITVNAVIPGSVLTSRATSTASRDGADVDAALAKRALGIPMKRHGNASEIGAVVRFMASDDSSYMTGQTIVVDGGGIPLNW